MIRKLSTYLFFALLLATAWTAAPRLASAQDAASVRQFLEGRDREIKQTLGNSDTYTAEQRESLKRVINDGIDFEAMARTALGPFWSQISVEQRAEFVDVFSEIVRNQSLSNLDVYRSPVTYKDIKVEGDSAYVVTSTVYKDVPAEVAYVLGRTDGAWRVRDIILDDVSTADGYARSFQTVMRKRGFDSLMQSLRKKLTETQS